MSLEVTSVKLFTSSFDGATRGYGVVTFNGLIEVKVNIVASKKGNLFLSFQQQPTKDKNGKTIYKNFVEWTKEAMDSGIADQISQKVCEEFTRMKYLNEGHGTRSGSTTPATTSAKPAETSHRVGFLQVPTMTEAQPEEEGVPFDVEPTPVVVPTTVKKPSVIWEVPT